MQTTTTAEYGRAMNTTSDSLPEALVNLVNNAIALLTKTIRAFPQSAQTHEILIAEGWADTEDTEKAVAAYFIGLLGSTIAHSLDVRAAIENTPRDHAELRKSVTKLTGSAAAPLTEKQKTDSRNPWMAECLWHLCLFIASKRDDMHSPGKIVALDAPHILAQDHGFDGFALYKSTDQFGVAFVESKAYENNPNNAISDAVAFFRAVNDGTHDSRARQTLQLLRQSIPIEDQPAISASLWKDTRTYLPNPHYDDTNKIDWTNNRPSLKDLLPTKDHIIVMPHPIKGFGAFFDRIAQHMQAHCENITHV